MPMRLGSESGADYSLVCDKLHTAKRRKSTSPSLRTYTIISLVHVAQIYCYQMTPFSTPPPQLPAGIQK